jgi:eukaryotic-like serine/threonine-protein kinase
MTATADEARVDAPLTDGARLARGYDVIVHLRRGRDLDVYDVWSEERDCRCVAKVPRPDKRAHQPTRRRLRREGRLLLSLAHPHIVRAYELIERPDPILVLETIDGETVDHLVGRRRQRLPATDIAYLGMHLCSAVQFLHRNGIIHLDLKPSNVISDMGQAKLIDLSIARPPQRVRPGIGTRRYMAPEQAHGGAIGPFTDVWGIGTVLFEAATAVPPFGQDGIGGGLNGSAPTSVSPNVRRHRQLPTELARVIQGCLEMRASDRPAVMEVSRILDRFAESQLNRVANGRPES